MIIHLESGYTYDLSDKAAFKNLKKNISTMCSRNQKDRLPYIYRQVEPYKDYQGQEILLRRAKEIYNYLSPRLPRKKKKTLKGAVAAPA